MSAGNTNDKMIYSPIGSEPYTKPKTITKPNKTVISNSIVDMYPSVFNRTAFRIDHIRLVGSTVIFTILGR